MKILSLWPWPQGRGHPRGWFGRKSLPMLADFSLSWAEGEVKMYRMYSEVQNLDQNFSLKSWNCRKTSPSLKALGWPLQGHPWGGDGANKNFRPISTIMPNMNEIHQKVFTIWTKYKQIMLQRTVRQTKRFLADSYIRSTFQLRDNEI